MECLDVLNTAVIALASAIGSLVLSFVALLKSHAAQMQTLQQKNATDESQVKN